VAAFFFGLAVKVAREGGEPLAVKIRGYGHVLNRGHELVPDLFVNSAADFLID
jgi:hypothetical protein